MPTAAAAAPAPGPVLFRGSHRSEPESEVAVAQRCTMHHPGHYSLHQFNTEHGKLALVSSAGVQRPAELAAREGTI
jgi:hypothetical protein